MLFSAALTAFFFLFPGSMEMARPVEVPIFCALLLLGLVTMFVLPRLSAWWWLDVCIVVSGLIAAWAVAAVQVRIAHPQA